MTQLKEKQIRAEHISSALVNVPVFNPIEGCYGRVAHLNGDETISVFIDGPRTREGMMRMEMVEFLTYWFFERREC